MRRFVLGLAAVASLSGSLMLAAPAQAHSHGHYYHAHGCYHVYRGIDRCLIRDYCGWSRVYFDARYGCNLYFSPEANSYYYWYGPGATYLPVSSFATYPPTGPIPAPPVALSPAVPPPSAIVPPPPAPVNPLPAVPAPVPSIR